MTDKMKKFMNIWEIEQHFKCPVIGAMLTVEKHKSILKKCGWDVKSLKPYEYHSHLMGCMGEENAVSIKVNNFIRHQARKYMVEVERLYDRGDKQGVRDLWHTYAGQGIIGPVMYTIVSHEDTDIELLQDIHGEVHMLAHANMTEVFHVRRQLASAEENLTREKRKLTDKNTAIQDLARQRRDDRLTIDRLNRENHGLKKQVGTLNPGKGKADKRADEEELRLLREMLAQAQEENQALSREKKQIQIELFSAENENKMIREELQTLSESFTYFGDPANVNPADGISHDPVACPVHGDCSGDACPNYHLCAKRIFMIGGITKMKSYYREIVESAGGEFDYHDGYLKNSNANLAAKVKRCDVVVCPVSCNSHNACLKVKKLCQQYNKELKILNSASLSAVTRAIMVPRQPEIN